MEVRLEADLGRQGLPNLIGIIDLVRAGGCIVDFKTTEATGEKEAGFELYHLVKVKAPKLVVTPLPPITENQQTRLFRMMESYVEGVRQEDYDEAYIFELDWSKFISVQLIPSSVALPLHNVVEDH